MEWLHELFKKSPEIALFLSLAVGYYIGKIKFGSFQLGGVAGSLLVAVLVSQVGVAIDPGVKSVLFALSFTRSAMKAARSSSIPWGASPCAKSSWPSCWP